MAKKKNDSDGSIGVLDIDELAGLFVDASAAGDPPAAPVDPIPVATAPEAPAPAVPQIEKCTITASMLPSDVKLTGYLAQIASVNVDFSQPLAKKFRRLIAGLNQEHATYPGPGGRVIHVDSGADAIKWLISQLPD